MATNSERKRLSRDTIQTAVLSLMKEKEYSKISIEDIIRRAKVSRMAYYRNYSSKDEILESMILDICRSMEEELSSALKISLTDEGHRLLFWETLFRLMKEHASTYQTLLQARQGQRILQFFNLISGRLIPSAVTPWNAYFWSGAAFNMVTLWITTGMKESPQEMAQICVDCLTPPLKKI